MELGGNLEISGGVSLSVDLDFDVHGISEEYEVSDITVSGSLEVNSRVYDAPAEWESVLEENLSVLLTILEGLGVVFAP